MKGLEIQIDRSNVEQQMAFDIVANTNTCLFITASALSALGYCDDFKVNEYKDMLVIVSGVLSGPLGFIVGYYFDSIGEASYHHSGVSGTIAAHQAVYVNGFS